MQRKQLTRRLYLFFYVQPAFTPSVMGQVIEFLLSTSDIDLQRELFQ